MTTATETIEQLANREYKYGFVTDVESESIPKGLSEDVVRLISAKKNEPEWLLEWRLKAYRHWLTMKEPTWQNVKYDPINYQDIIYYSAPKKKKVLNSLDEVDPEVRGDLRQARHPARRAEDASPASRSTPCSTASRSRRRSAKSSASMGIIFCRSPRRCTSTRSW